MTWLLYLELICTPLLLLLFFCGFFICTRGYSQTSVKVLVFFAGVGPELKQELRSILDIPVASLLVQYLGVPLISTKLCYSNCIILKDRMLRRILV